MLGIFIAPSTVRADGQRLVDAAHEQNVTALQTLLALGADVDARQPDGATALHWAVHWEDQEAVGALLRAGANPNVATDLGVTPLAMACANGNSTVVERLLKAGADPNAVPSRRPPALMLCVRTGAASGVDALLAAGADVNLPEPLRRQTALMWAAAGNRHGLVRRLLGHGADLHARSLVTTDIVNRGNPNSIDTSVIGGAPRGGSTPLLFAVARGAVESAKLLLEAGAGVNDEGPDGASALVVAAYSGQREMATLLLEAGADPNRSRAGYAALHVAVLRGDAKLVGTLIAQGAALDVPLQRGTTTIRGGTGYVLPEELAGATPFLLAAKFLERDIMLMLLAGGADPRRSLADGTTALMMAAGVLSEGALFDRRGRVLTASADDDRPARAIVESILGLGVDVNAVNERLETALHGAARRGYVDVVRLLIERGARADLKNRNGATAVDLAAGRVNDLLRRSRPD